jgi:hypothetical protein
MHLDFAALEPHIAKLPPAGYDVCNGCAEGAGRDPDKYGR